MGLIQYVGQFAIIWLTMVPTVTKLAQKYVEKTNIKSPVKNVDGQKLLT